MSEKKFVWTVTGPVPAEKLGRCLIHEHLIWGAPGYWGDYGRYDDETIVKRIVEELETLKPYGVKTIVDATPIDCGRRADLLKEASLRCGLNIVCISGYYSSEGGCTQYYSFRMKYGNAPQEVYEMLLREVTEGIGDTGIRPGLLKVATSNGKITDYENLFLEACARVSVETGTKIITHTQDGTMGSEQARRLIALGVKPEHIMIGHLNECQNIGELVSIMSYGVYGGYDRMGLQGYLNCPPELWQVSGLCALTGIGYGDKLIMSHDLSLVRMGRDWTWTEDVAGQISDWNYRHIFTKVIPFLRKNGMSELQAYAFVEDNPQRFLAG